MNYALDACAMLAYLRGEPGGDVVASMLTDPSATCFAHRVNQIEVYYDILRRKDESSASKALSALYEDGVIERRDMSKSFALYVGQLKARGRLSIADCFCIALAHKIGAVVVTSDHLEFDPLISLGIVPIRFIR